MSKIRVNEITDLNDNLLWSSLEGVGGAPVTTSSGEQTVAEALDNRVIYADTIADLQALVTSELVDGQQVQVKEYHAGTGVGGGAFYWDESEAMNHDGVYVFNGFVRTELGVTLDGAGLKDDGTSVSARLSEVMATVAARGGTLWGARPATYAIDATGVDVPSGLRAFLRPDICFKHGAHEETAYQLFRIHNVENVEIHNLYVEGGREHNSSNADGSAYGIRIGGTCKNVKLHSPVTHNCFTDGLNIASIGAGNNPEHIRIYNHHAKLCRRQGSSVVSGVDVKFIDPVWEDIGSDSIGGVLPGSGIDIEPYSNANEAIDITVVRPITRRCKRGIIVSLAHLERMGADVKRPVVRIIDPTDYDSESIAFVVNVAAGEGGIQGGLIQFTNPVSVNCKGIPFSLGGIPGRCEVVVERPTIINPNMSGNAGIFSTALYIESDKPAGFVTGNVHISDISIYAPDPSSTIEKLTSAGGSGATVRDVTITDPVFIEPELMDQANFMDTRPVRDGGGGIRVLDRMRVTHVEMESSRTFGGFPPPHILCTNTIDSITLNLPLRMNEGCHDVEIEVKGGGEVVVSRQSGEILIDSTGPVVNLKSTTIGSTLVVRPVAPGTWLVVQQSGVWTA